MSALVRWSRTRHRWLVSTWGLALLAVMALLPNVMLAWVALGGAAERLPSVAPPPVPEPIPLGAPPTSVNWI